ncbi:50S ribosomal protein L39e [Nanoarchaeota archaeon]|nr:MAG: 50S ribosomal protein L39e [Nanoarchaeota archaeon]
MARNKLKSVKKRLISAGKSCRPAVFWAILRKFGKRGHRWRLNPHKRRHWRKSKIKV